EPPVLAHIEQFGAYALQKRAVLCLHPFVEPALHEPSRTEQRKHAPHLGTGERVCSGFEERLDQLPCHEWGLRDLRHSERYHLAPALEIVREFPTQEFRKLLHSRMAGGQILLIAAVREAIAIPALRDENA